MNIDFLAHIGKYVIMLRSMIARPEKLYMFRKEWFRQMNDIGVGSVLIVGIISIFIGAVMAVQYAYQLDGSYVPNYYIGYIVRDSMLLEFAPNMTCIVLAGKVGSNVAAELGGMRQREQIDALDVMGVNTTAYLILPRILAGVLMIPLLVIFSAFIGMLGGYIASGFTGILTYSEYEFGLYQFYNPYAFTIMTVKSLVFAFILTSVACYKGYYVEGGSVELGKASTQSVILSNILIVSSDYLVTLIMT